MGGLDNRPALVYVCPSDGGRLTRLGEALVGVHKS